MNLQQLKSVIQAANRSALGDKELAREIRLADVLWSINQFIYTIQELAKPEHDEFNFYRYKKAVMTLIMAGGWNLRDDNLDNQSPELHLFLINLLCK